MQTDVPAIRFPHHELAAMISQRTVRRQFNAASPLQIYLQDINDTPLLSAEQERELADRVAAGDPYAREHMVKANLRLVVNIARGYLGKGLSLEDLIEEGNLGLMRAVEGFDGRMETRFSTYASYWIKQSIRRSVMNNGKPIRLPAYMVSLLSKWKRATSILTDRLGRVPTPDEVGKALRLSKKKIGIVAKAIRVNNLMPHTEGAEDEGMVLDDVLTDDRSKAAGGPDDRGRRPGPHLRPPRGAGGSRGRGDPHAVRPRAVPADDPPRGRREPGPDPRAGPPARDPGTTEADARRE